MEYLLKNRSPLYPKKNIDELFSIHFRAGAVPECCEVLP